MFYVFVLHHSNVILDQDASVLLQSEKTKNKTHPQPTSISTLLLYRVQRTLEPCRKVKKLLDTLVGRQLSEFNYTSLQKQV